MRSGMYLFCLVLSLFVSTLTFGEDSSQVEEEFSGAKVLLGAHRGGRGQWPENTLLAYKEASKQWPNALLEGDVQVTADGHLVMMHDARVDRTTNGTGNLADMTLAELKALDAAYHFTRDGGKTFPYRGKGVQVPTLEEVLKEIPNHCFLIELKDGKDIVETTVNIVRKLKAEKRFMFASFNPIYMAGLKQYAPEMETCYDIPSALKLITFLRNGHWEQYTPEHRMLTSSKELEEQFHITPEEIKMIQQKGILYQVHTVNSQEEMKRLLAMGVDSILTDYPDRLAALLEKRSSDRKQEL